MNKNCSWDNLKLLTKNEIIMYLKERYFYHSSIPDEYNVAYFKYRITSEKLLKEMDEHNKKTVVENSFAAIKELKLKIVNEKDIKKIVKLQKKILFYHDKVVEH